MKREKKRDEPERVSLAPLDPVEALMGLLRVEPEKTGSDSGENGRKHRKKKPAKKG